MNITSSFCSVLLSFQLEFQCLSQLKIWTHITQASSALFTLFVFSLLAVSHERPSLPLLVFVCHIDYLLFDLIVQLWKGTT